MKFPRGVLSTQFLAFPVARCGYPTLVVYNYTATYTTIFAFQTVEPWSLGNELHPCMTTFLSTEVMFAFFVRIWETLGMGLCFSLTVSLFI